MYYLLYICCSKCTICYKMDGPGGIILVKEIRQRRTNTMWFHLFVGSKKTKQTMNRTKQKLIDTENKMLIIKGVRGGSVQFSSVSRVWFFATPWIAVRQASLSITNSQSLLKYPQWGRREFLEPVIHRYWGITGFLNLSSTPIDSSIISHMF